MCQRSNCHSFNCFVLLKFYFTASTLLSWAPACEDLAEQLQMLNLFVSIHIKVLSILCCDGDSLKVSDLVLSTYRWCWVGDAEHTSWCFSLPG